jgi:hypothetical protein
MATSERRASSAASAGLIPGSNSTCAFGRRFLNSSMGDDGRRCRFRMTAMILGPPIVMTAAYPPGETTALHPVPIGTPTCA